MKFRNFLFISAAMLICTASMSGQLYHTWVSSSGSDSNNCASTSPCLTFGNALSKTSAGGVISAMDAGDYGPLTITQSVTLDGNNFGGITFSSASGAGITVTGGVIVNLQNLTINGLGTGGYGIYASDGGRVTVDNCTILNIVYDGIYFGGAGNLKVENSRIDGIIGGTGSRGIEILADYGEKVLLKNTIIDASPVTNYNSGFVIDGGTGPVNAALQNVTIIDAGDKAVVSATGDTQIIGSVLTQSTNAVFATNGATISVAGSLITSNVNGVCSQANSKIRLDNNDIYDNTTAAIAYCGGIVKTSTTNKTSGTIAIPASEVSDSVTF